MNETAMHIRDIERIDNSELITINTPAGHASRQIRPPANWRDQ
jgi:hypothetical protein